MSKRILVVDDDPHIREVIRFALEKAGMTITEAAHGRQGLEQIARSQPDLVILDIVMPEMDGLEMCRELRKHSEVPIVFLSSRDDELDRIIGLEIGGDDYVTKPFSPRELVARVNVILKRLTKAETLSQEKPVVLSHGAIQMDVHAHSVRWQGQPVVLTATEFALLEAFLRAPSRVFSRDDLMACDVFEDAVQDRTIDSHIRRLRQKFTDAGATHLIETVHGVGYKLGACQ